MAISVAVGRWISAATGVLVTIALVAGCGQVAQSPASKATGGGALGAQLFPVAARQPLPAIVGSTLAGHPLVLRSLVGRGVLVINVWASWCENCREESGALATLSSALDPAKARFVGIDEQDVTTAARKYVASTHMGYPQLRDSSGTTLNALTLLPHTGIPSTLLVDRNGLMAARIVGPLTLSQLQKLIDQVGARS